MFNDILNDIWNNYRGRLLCSVFGLFIGVVVLWLGFFFGFFGMAFWFFARKLYKLGLVLALCGLILAGADIAVNYNAYHTLFTETAQLFAAAVESGANPELLIADYSRLVGNFATAINPIVSFAGI